MPRKGDRKVRSGCLTCKIRKVKCDELKPSCNRCTSTGRKCDGYAILITKVSHKKVLVLPCSELTIAKSNVRTDEGRYQISEMKLYGWREDEVRALDFFCEVVGPGLSGDLDSYFWTHLVGQLTHCENAVRHAMVSISMLFEQQHNSKTVCSQLPNSTQALKHYNAAIRSLRSAQDETVVLLTCILFVCVEFLLGNAQLATNHCRHGTLMFNAFGDSSAVARHHLAPMYWRMSIFPYFFGSTVSTFPPILASALPRLDAFCSVQDVQQSLDELLSRSIRFVRKADEYRLDGSMHLAVPSSLQQEKDEVQALLGRWNAAFGKFVERNLKVNIRTYCMLQIKYLVVKIWSATALERTEMAFDRYLDQFHLIESLASQLIHAESAESVHCARPSFIFEMGFLPLLYFVVIKCRDIKLRLSALSLMDELAAKREGLWDVKTMSVVGRRVVELEHGITLAEINTKSARLESLSVPLEKDRIWDSMLGPESACLSEGGCSTWQRKATFILQLSSEELLFKDEWLTISP